MQKEPPYRHLLTFGGSLSRKTVKILTVFSPLSFLFFILYSYWILSFCTARGTFPFAFRQVSLTNGDEPAH